ncbi:MAG: GGDEF domain-containing protein [Caulobacteraceae bacterium]|nr:GGDEF domain-containing protein [Caulobacteraceae bacterium]
MAAIEVEGRSHSQTALVLFDLDRFKAVNDIHGHGAGDQLLRLVSDRFRAELAPGQTVHRMGGDEFACVINANAKDDAPQRLARRCIQSICEPFESNGLIHHIGASAGIAMFPATPMKLAR